MKNVIKYFYCVYFNKATLVGFLLLILPIIIRVIDSIILIPSENLSSIIFMSLIMGVWLIVATLAGMSTYDAFKKTELLIEMNGVRVSHLLKQKSNQYCWKAGVNAALAYYKKS